VQRGIAVFSGNAHRGFAEAVCRHLEMPLGDCEVFEFSNENIFVRFRENIRERDVFLVQPIVSPVNTRLMELLIMIDAAKRASAGRVTAVIPYYAYGRSDKKDQPRVPISARLIANFLEVAGADRVLTVDLHAGQIQGFFNIPLDELTAYPLIAEYFRSANLARPMVVATDVGGAKSAANMASRLDSDLAIVDKRRTDNSEQATGSTLIGDVSGRMQLAHAATSQAVYAVEHAIKGEEKIEEVVIPGVIFTSPEVGLVGLTELEAKKLGIDYNIGKHYFRGMGKALASNETEGFVKIIAEKDTDRIIGAQCAGPHATDLISEMVIAVREELTAEELGNTVHAHPTFAEVWMEAAHALHKACIHAPPAR
jgi:hypothetical protein